jgi:homoserine O-acetyltransferase
VKSVYVCEENILLENGETLLTPEITFHTYGKMNESKSNVVWVFHALTANSDAEDWWKGLVGNGKIFDPEKYFIVCANILGSCYGSCGPLSKNPKTQKQYFLDFPMVTIRDMVKAHQQLKKHLGIEKIKFGAGGSMGGYQLMEWVIEEPDLFENILLLATGAKESAWGVAIHEAQRLAIVADNTFSDYNENAGKKGLRAARGIGMLTYRNYELFRITQEDPEEKLKDLKASSYIKYQGEKLMNRFNAHTYYYLTQAMDSHDVGRGRGGIKMALSKIKGKTLIIGISSDILCPNEEQEFLHQNMPGSKLVIIDSQYGHDGFLIENDKITAVLNDTFHF